MSLHKISLILPYYMNAGMLKRQLMTITRYDREVLDHLQVIVVDDASPKGERAEEMLESFRPDGEFHFDFQLYRILTDLRWNQDGARNLGVHHASNPWVLSTDIDHIVPGKLMRGIMESKLNPEVFYTFNRVHDHDGMWKAPHPNSYLLTRKMYWEAGGYDEYYCGHYGTDGMFRRDLDKVGKHVPNKGSLRVVGRSQLPDASTRTLTRKDDEDKKLMSEITEYKKNNNIQGKKTLCLPWKRVI